MQGTKIMASMVEWLTRGTVVALFPVKWVEKAPGEKTAHGNPQVRVRFPVEALRRPLWGSAPWLPLEATPPQVKDGTIFPGDPLGSPDGLKHYICRRNSLESLDEI